MASTGSVIDIQESNEYLSIKKARCNWFIPQQPSSDTNESTERRCMCGKLRSEHKEDAFLKPANATWSVEACTIGDEDTDADGEIKFHISNMECRCKYIRIYYDTKMEIIIKLLLNKWKLVRPKFIISLLNSNTQNITNENTKTQFTNDIVNAVMDSNGWIITNGLYSGVLRDISQVVNKESLLKPKMKIPLLGIASWYTVADNSSLINRNNKNGYVYYNPYRVKYENKDEKALDPNHTHILLVDFGQKELKSFRRDLRAKFRDNVEYELSIKLDIPIVKLVLGNSRNQLYGILNAIEKKIPCLFLEGTGKCADLCDYLLKLTKDTKKEAIKEKFLSVWDPVDSDEYVQCIQNIAKYNNLNELFSSYKLVNNNESFGLDVAIFNAILKTRTTIWEKLKLLFEWNRHDIAKTLLVNEPDWMRPNSKQSVSIQLIYHLMFRSIIENKYQFVKLLMDHGLNLMEFANQEILAELYKEENIEDPFIRKRIKECGGYRRFVNKLTNLDLYQIEQPIYEKIWDFRYKVWKKVEKKKAIVPLDFPERDLFIYCIILEKVEMAKLFMFKSKHDLASSLIAIKIYQSLRIMRIEYVDEGTIDHALYLSKINNYVNLAEKFEKLACNLLDYFYMNDSIKAEAVLTYRMKEFRNLACFEMVDRIECSEFISNVCFQNVVSNIWRHKGKHLPDRHYFFLAIIFLIFSPILILFYGIYKVIEAKKRYRGKMFLVLDIYDMPLTKFIYDGVFHFLFLVLFSFVLLCNYYSISNSSKAYYTVTFYNLPISIIEIVLIIWRLSYLPILTYPYIKLYQSRIIYFSTSLRFITVLFDRFGDYVTLLFVYALMISSLFRFYDSFYLASRIILTVELLFWYIKFLQKYSLIRKIGPKLQMIKLMLIELLKFMLVLLVIVFAFGVSIQSLMYHNQVLDTTLLTNVFFPAYMMIAGVYDIFETMKNDSCTSIPSNDQFTQNDCPDNTGRIISLILLVLYIVIVTIMAINLLIAIFNNTFEGVNSKAEQIYNTQKYKILINEYIDRPKLPPPFIIISYIMIMIQWPIRKIIETCKNRKVSENSDNRSEKNEGYLWRLFLQKNEIFDNEESKSELIDWVNVMSDEFFVQYFD